MTVGRVTKLILLCLVVISFFLIPNYGSKSSARQGRPSEIDVRGLYGVPKGTALRAPLPGQLKALAALNNQIGSAVTVRYNGLTATPRHMFSYSSYLTPPTTTNAEQVARGFLYRWRDLFRFSDGDLNSLRLKSRAYAPDIGTTIMLFEQSAGGVSVYHGEVLVNVNRNGQIINVGGESFPQMKILGAFAITPAQAVTAAAASMGITGFTPQATGTKKVLKTFGNLPPEYTEGTAFSGGDAFGGEIVVTRTIFPMGDEGRPAYKFVLTTPQYDGIMWENVVDAETGQVLRRISLTSFSGPRGGGQGQGRLATFRPDIQDKVEAMNPASTAQAKVFDGMPTALSGDAGFGRAPAPGTPPTYAIESDAGGGRGFRASLVNAHNQDPLVYSIPFGQVIRGLPDALNPSTESPFGWFYLPTDSSGAEIATSGDPGRAATRGFGYTMTAEARDRNLAANSPGGDKDQPFSAALAALPRSVTLKDGRVLSSVYQSNYTEGNNVVVADDRWNDDETSQGIRGFSLNRQFTASYFDFTNGYEFGGINASMADTDPRATFPATANIDIFPGTLALFYYNNIIHDYLYSIGFTETLWNFQQDNFGRGGAGQDGVSAQVQDGSGINNANFGTPADGSYPRMQMYLFTESSFRRSDGDFDFDVVAHEHYHGVSNRSVGKGDTGGLGIGLVGEPSGMGEGWSDYNADTIADDDDAAEYVTGNFDIGIRKMPVTNYPWSYASITGVGFLRNRATPSNITGGIPFEVHDVGEVWSAVLWDMRELLIMKDPNGVFFDGARRLGNGIAVYIGNRQVQSIDSLHPIDYRSAFNTDDPATINASQAIVRPGLVAAEIAARGDRSGPLATAIAKGARLSDTLVLRGMQLSPLIPSFVDSRDSILLADRELTGGENQALIWRAFASHGVGAGADSTASGNIATQAVPVIVEDFAVPATVSDCEALGPLASPAFTARNLVKNTVTITINDGIPVRDAATYVIARATNASGPFVKVGEIPGSDTTFRDNDNGAGLNIGQTLYYQVRATRNPECVSSGQVKSVSVSVGDAITPAPEFAGVDQVTDPAQCNKLTVSWKAATSANTAANIVYDVYRVNSIPNGDGRQAPTFAPSSSNRIANGITATSFTDTGLTMGRVYYYIVQARDTSNGKKDTNNTGNTVTKLGAPTSAMVTSTPAFAMENFESASATNRFAPVLVDSGSDPNEGLAVFQRVTAITPGTGLPASSMMYAPDFSPTEGTPDPVGTHYGGPSDFATAMGPLTLTQTSMLDFDQFFRTEANFDGGVIEISLGTPAFPGPLPNNTTTFDLGNYIIQGGYNGATDATLEGTVVATPLQGRRAWTGTKEWHHVRVALGSFAPGGANNPLGLPVFLRFRMTSDVATATGPDGGWYVDNLVINNYNATACPAGLARADGVDSSEVRGINRNRQDKQDKTILLILFILSIPVKSSKIRNRIMRKSMFDMNKIIHSKFFKQATRNRFVALATALALVSMMFAAGPASRAASSPATTPAASSAIKGEPGLTKKRVPNYDINLTKYAPRLPSATQLQALDYFKANLGDSHITASWDRATGSVDTIYDFASKPSSLAPEEAARQFIAANAGLFAVTDIGTLRLERNVEALGGNLLYFSQTYQGLPVAASGIGVMMDRERRIKMISGPYQANLSLNISPSLDGATAIARALSDLAKYKIEWASGVAEVLNPALDLLASQIGALATPHPELNIYPTPDGARLAYAFFVFSRNPFGMFKYQIDAATGEVLYREDYVRYQQATTPTADVYPTYPAITQELKDQGKISVDPATGTPLGQLRVQLRKFDQSNLATGVNGTLTGTHAQIENLLVDKLPFAQAAKGTWHFRVDDTANFEARTNEQTQHGPAAEPAEHQDEISQFFYITSLLEYIDYLHVAGDLVHNRVGTGDFPDTYPNQSSPLIGNVHMPNVLAPPSPCAGAIGADFLEQLLGLDNAFSLPASQTIAGQKIIVNPTSYGHGYLLNDLAIDFGVPYHEGMHSISTPIAGLEGAPEGAAMNEGQADLWAYSAAENPVLGAYVLNGFKYRDAVRQAGGNPDLRQWIRNADSGLSYSQLGTSGGSSFEEHRDGEIFAGTMWDIRELMMMYETGGNFKRPDLITGLATKSISLGKETWERIFLGSIYVLGSFNPDTFVRARTAMILADQALYPSDPLDPDSPGIHRALIEQVYASREIGINAEAPTGGKQVISTQVSEFAASQAKLAAPTGVTVRPASPDSARVSWQPVSGAFAYEVLKREIGRENQRQNAPVVGREYIDGDGATDGYLHVAYVKANQTSYVDNGYIEGAFVARGLKNIVSGEYVVRALNINANKQLGLSSNSAAASVPTAIVDVTNKVQVTIVGGTVRFANGKMEFDQVIKNLGAGAFDGTMYTPVELRIVSISNPTVTVANADNGGKGTASDAAIFRFGPQLSTGQTSDAKHLIFNDPNAQLFTFDAVVTARVQVDPAQATRYQGEPGLDLSKFDVTPFAQTFTGTVLVGDTGLQCASGVTYVDVPFTTQEGAIAVVGNMTSQNGIDLDLQLLDSAGRVLSSSGSDTANETVAAQVKPNQTYRYRVIGWAGIAQDFTIESTQSLLVPKGGQSGSGGSGGTSLPGTGLLPKNLLRFTINPLTGAVTVSLIK